MASVLSQAVLSQSSAEEDSPEAVDSAFASVAGFEASTFVSLSLLSLLGGSVDEEAFRLSVT